MMSYNCPKCGWVKLSIRRDLDVLQKVRMHLEKTHGNDATKLWEEGCK